MWAPGLHIACVASCHISPERDGEFRSLCAIELYTKMADQQRSEARRACRRLPTCQQNAVLLWLGELGDVAATRQGINNVGDAHRRCKCPPRAGCALMLEPALTYGQCSRGENGRGACAAPAPAPADDLYPPLPSERPTFYLGSATAAPQVPSARTTGWPPARPGAGLGVTGPQRGRSRAPSARTAGRPPSGTTLPPRPGTYTRTRRVRPAPRACRAGALCPGFPRPPVMVESGRPRAGA